MDRKLFLKYSILSGGATALGFRANNLANQDSVFENDEIIEFVFAAHSDLIKTRKIVEAKPLLLNCVSQVKKGDFETAVGGASHMGRKDIADMLVERGARLDLFNLVFLGFTEFAQKLIEIQPQYLKASGPHGFTLLHHAKAGNHKEFVGWLEDRGLEEDRFMDVF